MALVKAIAMYLDDVLGGMRQLNTITDINCSDNGGAESVFNTMQELIGFTGHEGGYTCTTTVQFRDDDPSEPDYLHLRATREQVNLTLEYVGALRLQHRAVLAKFDIKGDNQGKVTGTVEWSMGPPKKL